MKMFGILIRIMTFVFIAVQPAFANSGLGPNSMLAEMLLFVFLIALTAAGGGYRILKNSGEKWRIGWLGRVLASIMLIIFSAAFPLLFYVAVCFCIIRGITLVYWAWQARFARKGPEFVVVDSRRSVFPQFASANPFRLASAGAALIVFAAVLPYFGMVRDFSLYQTMGYDSAAEADLRNGKTCAESYFADHNHYPDTLVEAAQMAGCGQNSKGVHLEYRKLGPNKYQITSWHEKGSREYRSGSEDNGVFYRSKNESGQEWQLM